jgi:hypothetical protein
MDLVKINIRRTCLLPIAYCLLPITSFSQSPSVQTTADKKDILIGEQVMVKVKATYAPNSFTINKWLIIPDSISHFDVIDVGKADTISYKDDSKAIEQTITITSFDSGSRVFPSFDIQFQNSNDKLLQTLRTDSIPINVSYSPPDSTNQLRDIKPIIEVSITDYTWYYIAGGTLLLLLAVFLLRRYLKKRKLKPLPVTDSKLSPFEEAMMELGKLDQYDLQNAMGLKGYHSKLTDIFKRYLGRKQNKNLDNRTTGDLLIKMSENGFLKENISILATALRCSDAVKFAKYLPTRIETEDCKLKIKETINLIEYNLKPLNP